MNSRSSPGSPLRGRFRWLRRLFRRIKYRHAKFKDGKHTKGRGDVELWQEDHPIASADYPGYRWRGYSGLRPVLPQDMTSPLRHMSPRRHSTPPAPINPGAIPTHMAGRTIEIIPEGGVQSEQTDRNSVTTCIPIRKQSKKKLHQSEAPDCYQRQSSVDTCTQTQADAIAQAQADAAYLEFLRQEFKNKYHYLTQDTSLLDSNDHGDNVPKQVLDLDGCLQNPPKPIETATWPHQRPRRHTYDVSDSTVPAWSPMTSHHDVHRCERHASVHFQPTLENQDDDIVVDFQNVHNRFQSEDLSKRKKRVRRQRKRQRIRNQLYRKLVKPKGYVRLKEASDDKPEILKLESEFEQRAELKLKSSPRHRTERKQVG